MLQRLARTMYRRRRYVLVAWIVLLVGTFALVERLGGVFKTEFKLPGTESQAAFDLLERSSFRNRQVPGPDRVRGRARASTTRRCAARWSSSSPRSSRRSPTSSVVSPYSHEGARQIVAGRADRVRARSTSPTARPRRSPTPASRSRRSPTDVDVPGLARRVRRRHVRRTPSSDGASEAIGLARRDDHPADRVRVGARDGPADRHRAVRHRHRHRASC